MSSGFVKAEQAREISNQNRGLAISECVNRIWETIEQTAKKGEFAVRIQTNMVPFGLRETVVSLMRDAGYKVDIVSISDPREPLDYWEVSWKQ
jgi:hypothetical protein